MKLVVGNLESRCQSTNDDPEQALVPCGLGFRVSGLGFRVWGGGGVRFPHKPL